jgi:hypothetical protein
MMRRVLQIGVCVVLGACIIAIADEPPTFEQPVEVGRIESPLIDEASGLAASRVNADILYVHNDSGDSARIYAIDTTGRLVAILTLADVRVIDCEDMSVVRIPNSAAPAGVKLYRHYRSYVYLGDIGDNGRQRDTVVIYRFREPKIDTDKQNQPNQITIEKYERFEFRYEDGPHDAETLMVDPYTGDVLIVTKEMGSASVYIARAGELSTEEVNVLKPLAVLTPGRWRMVTGGDISHDGALILLRTYDAAMLCQRGDGPLTTKSFAGPWRVVPAAPEPQGEAIAFTPRSHTPRFKSTGYFTLSEGKNQPLHYIKQDSPD